MQLFIDANILLSFYHLTSEDLEQLEKLAVLIENEVITLLLPQHAIDETWRNRANKIKPALNEFKRHKFAPNYPAYCRDYEHYQNMRKAEQYLEKEHSLLVEKVQRDIDDENLGADHLLRRLHEAAQVIKMTGDILENARLRVELGNPPGKKGSIGDAVNWESLLASAVEADLHIISEDKDWCSVLDETKLNEFLQSEWRHRKRDEVILYRILSTFLKQHFPHIDLKTEEEKQRLIAELRSSPSFVSTHRIIAELSRYAPATFSPRQVDELYAALLLNHQVRWIAEDLDVRKFYEDLYNVDYNDWREHSEDVHSLLHPPEPEEEDEMPF